jgi:ABC-type sugar transport system ATPase subunit
MTICSRIAVLKDGTVMQVAQPAELVEKPANAFVASFLGLGALVPGIRGHSAGLSILRTPLGDISVGARELRRDDGPPGSGWSLLVRPSAVRFAAGAGLHRASARLVARSVEPSGVTLRIALTDRDGGEYPLSCFVPGSADRFAAMHGGANLTAVWIDPRDCTPVPSA